MKASLSPNQLTQLSQISHGDASEFFNVPLKSTYKNISNLRNYHVGPNDQATIILKSNTTTTVNNIYVWGELKILPDSLDKSKLPTLYADTVVVSGKTLILVNFSCKKFIYIK